jgi:hypothetical protein
MDLKHNRSLKVAVQGSDFMAHPLYIHTKWILHEYGVKGVDGRAIAQEVSRWLPTAAARVRARV